MRVTLLKTVEVYLFLSHMVQVHLHYYMQVILHQLSFQKIILQIDKGNPKVRYCISRLPW